MKRVLLTFPFLCLMLWSNAQISQTKKDPEFQWVARIGLNALDQASNNKMVKSKSALGFQIGGDFIWNPGWKVKGGLHYQYHEIFEFINQKSIITSAESQDRHFNRLKVTAGTLYDVINIDFLVIGAGVDLAYNFNLSSEPGIYSDFINPFKVDYLSSLFHLYFNINRIQVNLGVEGNIFTSDNVLIFFQSKTYALTVGYIF